MTDKRREIDELRQETAKLDAQLLTALEKRARISRQIGELRKHEPTQLPLNDRRTFHALVARASGEMPAEDLRAIFREIFASCLALELPVKIAYVGPEGGAAHVAARTRFGTNAEFVPKESVAAALETVAGHRAEFAVVALETKVDGPVQSTILALTATDLKIVAAIESSSTLHLMNRTGNLADIEKIYATAGDHTFCQKFLAAHPHRVSVLDVKSPFFACQVALEDHGAAALASEEFGVSLGLSVARRNIDEGSDLIRYAIVGARPTGRSGDDVTAFAFSLQDSPGALLDVLRQFSERGINLIKIQSHPAPGTTWSYVFFVEVTGHATDRTLVTAFEEVKRVSRSFKVLGSYPAEGRH
jgi:chorismate mutase / prephenate dehydratase